MDGAPRLGASGRWARLIFGVIALVVGALLYPVLHLGWRSLLFFPLLFCFLGFGQALTGI